MTWQNDRITSIPAPEPVDYDRQYSFTDWEALNPTSPKPASGLEAEFNAIQQALDETQARARLIQRSDGALANESVGVDQLKPDVQIGVNPPTAWTAFTGYAVRDSVVFNNEAWYVCLVAHTSGADFATDLAAEKWQLIFDFDDLLTTEVQALADAAEASALAAAASVAAVNLPSLTAADPGKLIVVNPTYDGYDLDVKIDSDFTANTVPLRDASGRLKANGPSATSDVANKAYVDTTFSTGSVTTAKLADEAVTADKLAAAIQVPVLLSTTAVTAAASIDLATAFSANPSYRYFMISVEGAFLGAGADTLCLRVSIDGSTFRSTAGDYDWFYSQQDSTEVAPVSANSSSDTHVQLGAVRLTTDSGDLVLRVADPHNTIHRKSFAYDRNHATGTIKVIREVGVGGFLATADDITGVQLLWESGGSFAAGGSVKVYGSNTPF